MFGSNNITIGSRVKLKNFHQCGQGVVTAITEPVLVNGWRLTSMYCDITWDDEMYGTSEQVPIKQLEIVK